MFVCTGLSVTLFADASKGACLTPGSEVAFKRAFARSGWGDQLDRETRQRASAASLVGFDLQGTRRIHPLWRDPKHRVHPFDE